jgi:hypothetical protein
MTTRARKRRAVARVMAVKMVHLNIYKNLNSP